MPTPLAAQVLAAPGQHGHTQLRGAVMTPEPAHQAAEQRGSDSAILSRRIRQAGLLDRRTRYYAWKISLTVAALVLGWATFAVIGDSWWQVGVAVFLAVAFAQIAFLGHDAGHSQVFH